MNHRPCDSYVWVIFLIISVLMYLNLYFHIHEHELRLDSYLEYCITRAGEEVPVLVESTTADKSIAKLKKDIIEPTTTLNITTHRVTTSPKSGRRFLAMVTSWTKSRSRRMNFYQAWHKAWPELTIVTEYSFLNHRRVRGYALLVSNVLGMHKALQFSTRENEDFDYFIILEDDAMPFPDTSWPTVVNSNNNKDWNNNDLDQMLDELEANNGGALFLGCHSVDSIDRQRLVENNGNIDGGASIAPLTFAFGSYAWMISRKHLPMLQQRFENVLQNKSSHTGTTDDDAHHFLQDQNIREYVAVPLLVDHHSDGESLTWDNKMKYQWEGNRDWWNFKDFKNPKRTSRKGE